MEVCDWLHLHTPGLALDTFLLLAWRVMVKLSTPETVYTLQTVPRLVVVEQFHKWLRIPLDDLLDPVKLRREKGINNGEKTIWPDRLFFRNSESPHARTSLT